MAVAAKAGGNVTNFKFYFFFNEYAWLLFFIFSEFCWRNTYSKHGGEWYTRWRMRRAHEYMGISERLTFRKTH